MLRYMGPRLDLFTGVERYGGKMRGERDDLIDPNWGIAKQIWGKEDQESEETGLENTERE